MSAASTPRLSDPHASPPAPPCPLALCITELDPGGAENALAQLVTRLDPAEWRPVVYCLGPETELAKWLREQGIPVECYGAASWRDLGAVCWLAKRLRRQRPQLLQSFLFHANIVGRFAGRLAGVPVILSGHRVAERERRLHLWLDRATRRLTDHHVCVSRGVADHVERRLGVDRQRFSVIPNGVERHTPRPDREARALRANWNLPAECVVALAAGRLHPQKGFLTLLEAFSRLVPERPELRLWIAGEGPQRRELERRINSAGLEGRVTLLGRREDLRELMEAADLFVLSSLWEGMPNVVLEAMAAGLPVAATDVEGIAELIENGRTGLVVTPGLPEPLAAAMSELTARPELRGAMGKAAQEHVMKNFTWEGAASAYARLYRDLLS